MAKADANKRGTKRTCQSCGARFYDLNRDPATCPMCSAVFEVQEEEDFTVASATAAVERAVRKPVRKAEVAEVEAEEKSVDVDSDDVEVEDDAVEGDDETFLEEEDEDTDVSGLIDGGVEEGGEEET